MQARVRRAFQAVALVAAGAVIGSWAVREKLPERGSEADAAWFLKTFQEEVRKQEAARLQEQQRQLPETPAQREELRQLRKSYREELQTLPAMIPNGSFINCAQDIQRFSRLVEAEMRLSQYDYEVQAGLRNAPLLRSREEAEEAQLQLRSYQMAVASCR